MTQFSGFVATPPAGQQWFNFGRFLVAVAVGLWVLPTERLKKRKDAAVWFGATALLAAAAIACVVHYSWLIERWTVPYFQNERAVIGATLTRDAAAYREGLQQAGQPSDDLTLLRKYGGDAGAVWEAEEIGRRSNRLTVWYLTALFILASVVVSLAQMIYCARRR